MSIISYGGLPVNPDRGGEWTRDDLPSEGELADLIRDALDGRIYEGKMLLPGSKLRAIIDLLAGWMNAHHPKPDGDCSQSEVQEWVEVVRELHRERDEAQMERTDALRERDAAVARAKQAETEFEKAKNSTLSQLDWAGFLCGEEYQDLVERAEAAERELGDLRDKVNAWGRVADPEKTPAWTRDDLPGVHSPGIHGESERQGAEKALDAVVEHLNAHHPKPEQAVCAQSDDDEPMMPRETLRERTVSDGRLWNQAYAEGVASAERVLRERDEQEDDATRAACERAEQAEQELGELRSKVDAWGQDQPAPAVTREDVKGVIDYWIEQGGNHESLLDDLWRWVSGDDPAVFVVRESQIAAVEVERGAKKWSADGEATSDVGNDPEWLREPIGAYLKWVAGAEAVARVVEAEPADPVEAKARELYALAHPGVFVPKGDDAELAPFRRLSAHVLGQEASDE